MAKQKLQITTADMEVALATRRDSPVCFLNHRVVVNKCAWLFGHEADMVSVTSAGYGTEVEIKVSKSDFMADFRKQTTHDSPYIKNLYYAVPEFMKEYALARLPENAGLLVVYPAKPVGRVIVAKQAMPRKDAKKISDEMVAKMQYLMALRYWSRQQALRKKIWYDFVDAFNADARSRRLSDMRKATLNRRTTT